MGYHNGMQFTTFDHDADTSNAEGRNCAVASIGAWWYNGCYTANLNGKYLLPSASCNFNCVAWQPWRTHSYSLKETKMMLRCVGIQA